MPRTLETHAFALSRLRFLLARSSPTSTIPARHELRAFTAEMLERGLSWSSVRVRMRSIRCFANSLQSERGSSQRASCMVPTSLGSRVRSPESRLVIAGSSECVILH